MKKRTPNTLKTRFLSLLFTIVLVLVTGIMHAQEPAFDANPNIDTAPIDSYILLAIAGALLYGYKKTQNKIIKH